MRAKNSYDLRHFYDTASRKFSLWHVHWSWIFYQWSVFLLSGVLPYMATSEFRCLNTNKFEIFPMHRVSFYASVSDSDDVSFAEIEEVKQMIQLLNFYQGRLTDVRTLSEDELCTICYAYSISATFKPCNHQSCRYSSYYDFMSQLPWMIFVLCVQCASSMHQFAVLLSEGHFLSFRF